MFKQVLLMHFKFYQLHEVIVYIYAEALEMFGLVSGQKVQRRYSLSETTLQQGDFKDMVHRHVFIHEVCNFGQKKEGRTNENNFKKLFNCKQKFSINSLFQMKCLSFQSINCIYRIIIITEIIIQYLNLVKFIYIHPFCKICH